jgi:hypothetical protein
MNSIKEILTLPDKTELTQVQGLVTEVYAQREVKGGKTVQDAKLRDGTGSEIKLSVWDHPKIDQYKGREVIIQAGPKGGLVVKLDTYRQPYVNTLSVSKMSTFQNLEVHHAQNGAPKDQHPAGAGTPAGAAPVDGPKVVVNGAKIGMVINCSVEFMTAQGEPFTEDRVWELASQLINVSNKLERGEFYTKAQ